MVLGVHLLEDYYVKLLLTTMVSLQMLQYKQLTEVIHLLILLIPNNSFEYLGSP